MALRKIKNDITYYDADGKINCSYNKCYKKFVESYGFLVKTPQYTDYQPVKTPHFFHECTECGRKQRNKKDTQLTVDYAVPGLVPPDRVKEEKIPDITLEEYKIVLDQLLILSKKVVDREKCILIIKSIAFVEKEIDRLKPSRRKVS